MFIMSAVSVDRCGSNDRFDVTPGCPNMVKNDWESKFTLHVKTEVCFEEKVTATNMGANLKNCTTLYIKST